MNLNKDEMVRIITVLKEKIPSLQALYLFGSYADGSAKKSSDIDIAYLADDTMNRVEKWEIGQYLASKLLKDVDLIDLKETNTIFRYQIIETAERIYGSGYDVESFETLAYSFYLRFQEERRPILESIYADKTVLSAKAG